MDSVYVDNAIQAYLSQNNFKLVNEKGEDFYRQGGVKNGFKYWYSNGVLHIEAWLGKIGKEMDISDGKFYGAIYKITYYNSVLSLLGAFEKDRQIKQYSNTEGYEQQFTQPYGANNQSNIEVLQEINKSNDKNAVFAFVLAIVALFYVFGSRLSMLVIIGSYYLAFTYGLKSRKRGLAIAAIIINSLAAVIALLILVGSILG
jgi:hypothetical protein